jgi:cellulose biosynthesis protein BcsQ
MGYIATFYSFKGGVGRSMALANIACLLALRGLSVLIVDFDLEAPGIDKYFQDLPAQESPNGGLLNLLQNIRDDKHAAQLAWKSYLTEIEIADGRTLSLMKANDGSDEVISSLADFSWSEFFEVHSGGSIIESLREAWKSEYDVTLIDSRTGLTDSGGICTIQLPDVLVAVFTANNQSFFGLKDIIARAQKARKNALAYERMPLTVLPLASRFDGRTEFEESQKWIDIFAQELAEYYQSWLPKEFSPRLAVERTKIPHVPYFSFGEKLAVLSKSIDDPESLGYAYESISSLLSADFNDVEKILGATRLSSYEPMSPLPTEDLDETDLILEAKQSSGYDTTSPFNVLRFLSITGERLEHLLVPALIMAIVLIICVAVFAFFSLDRNSDRMIATVKTEYNAKLSELNSQISKLNESVSQRDQVLANASINLKQSKQVGQKYRQIIEGASKNSEAISVLDKKIATLGDEMISMAKKLSEIQELMNKISSGLSSLSLDKEPSS